MAEESSVETVGVAPQEMRSTEMCAENDGGCVLTQNEREEHDRQKEKGEVKENEKQKEEEDREIDSEERANVKESEKQNEKQKEEGREIGIEQRENVKATVKKENENEIEYVNVKERESEKEKENLSTDRKHVVQSAGKEGRELMLDKPADIVKLMSWIEKTRAVLRRSDEEWEKLGEVFDERTTKEEMQEKLARVDRMSKRQVVMFLGEEVVAFAEKLKRVMKRRSESKQKGEWSEEKEQLLLTYLKDGVQVRMKVGEKFIERMVQGSSDSYEEECLKIARLRTEVSSRKLAEMGVEQLVQIEEEEMKERPQKQQDDVTFTAHVIMEYEEGGMKEERDVVHELMDVVAEKVGLRDMKEKLTSKARMKQKQLEKKKDMLIERLECMLAATAATEEKKKPKKKQKKKKKKAKGKPVNMSVGEKASESVQPLSEAEEDAQKEKEKKEKEDKEGERAIVWSYQQETEEGNQTKDEEEESGKENESVLENEREKRDDTENEWQRELKKQEKDRLEVNEDGSEQKKMKAKEETMKQASLVGQTGSERVSLCEMENRDSRQQREEAEGGMQREGMTVKAQVEKEQKEHCRSEGDEKLKAKLVEQLEARMKWEEMEVQALITISSSGYHEDDENDWRLAHVITELALKRMRELSVQQLVEIGKEVLDQKPEEQREKSAFAILRGQQDARSVERLFYQLIANMQDLAAFVGSVQEEMDEIIKQKKRKTENLKRKKKRELAQEERMEEAAALTDRLIEKHRLKEKVDEIDRERDALIERLERMLAQEKTPKEMTEQMSLKGSETEKLKLSEKGVKRQREESRDSENQEREKEQARVEEEKHTCNVSVKESECEKKKEKASMSAPSEVQAPSICGAHSRACVANMSAHIAVCAEALKVVAHTLLSTARGRLHDLTEEDREAARCVVQSTHREKTEAEEDEGCFLQQNVKRTDKPEDLVKMMMALKWIGKTCTALMKSDEEWEKLGEMFDDRTTKKEVMSRLDIIDRMSKRELVTFLNAELVAGAEKLSKVMQRRREHAKKKGGETEQREESLERVKEGGGHAKVDREYKQEGEWSEEKEKLLMAYLRESVESRLDVEQKWQEKYMEYMAPGRRVSFPDDTVKLERMRKELATKALTEMSIEQLEEKEMEELKERPKEKCNLEDVLLTAPVVLEHHEEEQALINTLLAIAREKEVLANTKERLGQKDRMKQKQRVNQLEKEKDMLMERLERMIAPEEKKPKKHKKKNKKKKAKGKSDEKPVNMSGDRVGEKASDSVQPLNEAEDEAEKERLEEKEEERESMTYQQETEEGKQAKNEEEKSDTENEKMLHEQERASVHGRQEGNSSESSGAHIVANLQQKERVEDSLMLGVNLHYVSSSSHPQPAGIASPSRRGLGYGDADAVAAHLCHKESVSEETGDWTVVGAVADRRMRSVGKQRNAPLPTKHPLTTQPAVTSSPSHHRAASPRGRSPAHAASVRSRPSKDSSRHVLPPPLPYPSSAPPPSAGVRGASMVSQPQSHTRTASHPPSHTRAGHAQSGKIEKADNAGTSDKEGRNVLPAHIDVNDVLCVVCMNARRQTVFLPCWHQVCCVECGKEVKECPMCRADIHHKGTPFG